MADQDAPSPTSQSSGAAASLPHPTLLETYQALVNSHRLSPDPAQSEAILVLAGLLDQWNDSEAIAARNGILVRLFHRPPYSPAIDGLQGVYLWGDVGRGKSLLMDMLFDCAPLSPKRRVHYHAFMLEVHARIHRWREENRENLKTKDPIPPLAKALAAEANLLCLDEFQVTDVADAMILGRLFTSLLNYGVRVVVTSNRKPDDLYLGGLQRDHFLKFIGLVHERMQVLELASAEDYRLKKLRAMQDVYIVAPESEARERMDAAFLHLIHDHAPRSKTLNILGHTVHVPLYYGDVARFSFKDLCEKPLGAVDYLQLAQEFATIMIDNIPVLSPEKRNEAKRFVTLIDAMYEHKRNLVCSASVPPDKLYPDGDGSFEFGRTVSRLMEMQSESYLAASGRLA